MSKLSIEDEVLANLRRLPLGPGAEPNGCVGDLGLPLEYLRRAADRVIQSSFRERFRLVMGDGGMEHSPPSPPPQSEPLPEWIEIAAEHVAAVQSLEEFRPADPAFRAELGLPLCTDTLRVRSENATDRPQWIRVQITSEGYYAGPGDGGSLDIVRQLVESSEGATVFANVESRHLGAVAANASLWRPGRGVRLVLVPVPFTISQWARDNALAVHGEGGGSRSLLTPRWAGRGEEGGTYIPGESLAMIGLAAAGWDVRQSDLVFEGGNTLVVDDGARRVLLLGEGEVHRNVAAPRDEVARRFRTRFAVDEVIVLPAASFHIDLEVAVLPGHDRPVALVPDTLGAVRIVSRLAARKLAEAGRIESSAAARCEHPNCPLAAMLGALLPGVDDRSLGGGRYPYELARLFRASEVDSGVGNYLRIWFAVDYLMAECGIGVQGESHHAAHLRAIRRQERDRAAIARQLRHRGWKVVKVPAISSESCSLNPVNGVWMGNRYLMSAYGGFFEEMDRSAEDVIRREGVEVEAILTGETQRRGGGLHCAVSLG